MDFLEVLPLHNNITYIEACCDLINSEWKRSVVARMLSLKKSCDELPTSLVMVNNRTDVVGHSKLTPIPSIPDACFVESVVIAKEHRGKGWGRFLMEATEEHARSCGVQEIYLSAVPPVPAFYAKLGYEVCLPVCIYGGAVSNSSPRSSPVNMGPPPPPPLPSFVSHRKFGKMPKVYMKKSFYEVES